MDLPVKDERFIDIPTKIGEITIILPEGLEGDEMVMEVVWSDDDGKAEIISLEFKSTQEG